MYYAIKKIPFGKMILAVIGTLPIVIQQATSYSYDAVLNAGCFFLIAYFIYLIYEKEKVTWKDMLVLGIFTLLAIPSKVLYIFILGLGILIPTEKFGGWKKKILMAVGLLFIGGGIAIFSRLPALAHMLSGGDNAYTPWNGVVKYSLSDFITDPIWMVKIFGITLISQGAYFVESMIGSVIGWAEIGVTLSGTIVWGFIILLLIGTLQKETESKSVAVKAKVWIGVLSLVVCFAVMMSMLLAWTGRGDSMILGVQGRYFLPILPMVGLLLTNKTIYLKRNIEHELFIGLVVLQLFAVFEMLYVLMQR